MADTCRQWFHWRWNTVLIHLETFDCLKTIFCGDWNFSERLLSLHECSETSQLSKWETHINRDSKVACLQRINLSHNKTKRLLLRYFGRRLKRWAWGKLRRINRMEKLPNWVVCFRVNYGDSDMAGKRVLSSFRLTLSLNINCKLRTHKCYLFSSGVYFPHSTKTSLLQYMQTSTCETFVVLNFM